jgi:general secretion pathway protein G
LTLQRQREAALREALREIRGAIDRYRLAVDQGLIQRRMSDPGYPPDLAVLVRGAPNQVSPTREPLVFLRRIPRDPFNADTRIPAENSWRLRSYASPHDAPTPGADVFDVLTHGKGVGLNGVPYSEW